MINTIPASIAKQLALRLRFAAPLELRAMREWQVMFAVVELALIDCAHDKTVKSARKFLESGRFIWFLNLLGIEPDYVERVMMDVGKRMKHLEKPREANNG